jgi:hypothetical protein
MLLAHISMSLYHPPGIQASLERRHSRGVPHYVLRSPLWPRHRPPKRKVHRGAECEHGHRSHERHQERHPGRKDGHGQGKRNNMG